MTRMHRALALTRGEWRLRARAVLAVAGVRVALTILPFFRVLRLADRVPSRRAGRPSPADVDRAVRSAATFVPGATCLVRALAAKALLGGAGRRPALRLGVARDAARGFRAHAWVECADGSVVGDHGGPSFVPLAA